MRKKEEMKVRLLQLIQTRELFWLQLQKRWKKEEEVQGRELREEEGETENKSKYLYCGGVSSIIRYMYTHLRGLCW